MGAVEVIKGAQSSLYGTGAMGGIVNIITKQGRFGEKLYVTGNVISGFASVNRMFSNHANVSAGSKKWFLQLGGTYAKADDLRTPDGILENSRFSTSNISAKLGIKPFKNHEFRLVPATGPKTWGFRRRCVSRSGNGYVYRYRTPFVFCQLQNFQHYEQMDFGGIEYFTQYIVRDVEMKPNQVTEVTMPNSNINAPPRRCFIHRIASDKRRAGAGYLGFVVHGTC